MLEVHDLSIAFGGLNALDSVSLHIASGELVSVIGPNGAGKTTLFAAITGFHKPRTGRVRFCGEDISGEKPFRIARKGLVRTFQIVQPFAGQSVAQNIAVGAHMRNRRHKDALQKAARVAAQVGLADRLEQDAADLTVAGRKRLEMARALATDPKLLLLDEVMAGLNPSEVNDVIPIIHRIRDSGVTIMLIEHVMQAVMRLSEKTFVLSEGRMIASGAPGDVAAAPAVIEAYLGTGMADRLKRGALSGA